MQLICMKVNGRLRALSRSGVATTTFMCMISCTPSGPVIVIRRNGKQEVFKEKVVVDEEKNTLALTGLEGDVMTRYKLLQIPPIILHQKVMEAWPG
ncbi:hypothetical protein D5086_016578 [Populus alba]|uniref:Uncharacterized protein n=1 Tax=Populus alba TaxID=43335 RepID=A0ACC4BW69_POPAL